MIEIHIFIIKIFYIRKRLEHKQIVHVKGMFRKLQIAFSQKHGTVDHGMHQNVTSDVQFFCMIPLEYFIFRKCLVPHHFFVLRTCLVVDKIADEHINSLRTCHQFFQSFDNIEINIHIYPIIAVHHFIVYSGCITQSGIDCLSMSAVLLMDRLYDPRIIFFILICDLCGIVFCGTVIHN